MNRIVDIITILTILTDIKYSRYITCHKIGNVNNEELICFVWSNKPIKQNMCIIESSMAFLIPNIIIIFLCI